LAGLALRASGLDWNLPYQLDADEPVLFLGAHEIRATGSQTIKPGYSPLRMYELAAEQVILLAFSGGAAGQVQLFYFGRIFSALYSVLLAAVAYQAGRRLGGRMAGVLAALFLAVEPASAELGRLIRADALAWLLALSCLALSIAAAGRRARVEDIQFRTYTLVVAFGFGIAAFLAKYNMLPVLAAPGILLLHRLVPNPRARAVLQPGGVLVVTAGIILLRTNEGIQRFLAEHFALRRLLSTNYDFTSQVSANARLLFEGLGFAWLALAFIGLAFVWARARRLASAQMRAGAITASALLAAAIYTQADARFKDMYFLVLCLALLSGAGIVSLAKLLVDLTGLRDLSGLRTVVSVAAGLLLALPWFRADLQALADLRRPDTRIATAEWLRLNVPQGARVACEYDCVELQGGYGGFPGPQPFHTEFVRSAYERTLPEYQATGIEYVIADARASGYFAEAPDGDFVAAANEIPLLQDGEATGPQRALFQLAPLQQRPLYRWLGEAISFRGYDLPQTSVAAGRELPLTLYWMSARTTQADLIVFVHLVSEPGSPPVVGQDGPPLAGAQPTWRWAGDMQFWIDPRMVPIPADTPPGDYLVQIGMYDAGTAQRLPVSSPDGALLGDAIPLGTITIQAPNGP
jgi:4-amino-4-deoxy-L-arabinose transferase-like glycosyltransferase